MTGQIILCMRIKGAVRQREASFSGDFRKQITEKAGKSEDIMGKIKRIALITSTSNFERHRNVIKAVHKKLRESGEYVLYVLTSYGVFTQKDNSYDKGEAAIYKLLEETAFDGCIVESNLGSNELLSDIIGTLQKKRTPFVTMNFSHFDLKDYNSELEEFPSVIMDGYCGACKMMEHLITVHHCTRINLVHTSTNDNITCDSIRGYADMLKRFGIPFDQRRLVYKMVSLSNARELLDDFKAAGVEDAEAVICMHDVHALGICLELEARGKKVPDDMLVCSLNHSTNSVVFCPDISGVDRMDSQSAVKACELLLELMEGREVPAVNYVEGDIYFGGSCGCCNEREDESAREFQRIVFAKIEMGNQIRQMMQFNDSLDEVESIEGFAQNLMQMFQGISCPQFILCLNKGALDYISSERDFEPRADGRTFDYMMHAIVGETERSGRIDNLKFPVSMLLPVKPKENDLFLFYPIHHAEKVYGYLVVVNEYLPVEMQNYRICHESISSSMENLHRQMVMRSTISKLEELHMKDAMTGLYNRFAWDRFKQDYIERGKYCVVMLDMDGLKKINDQYGHIAGDIAITATAKMIQSSVQKEDLVTRCGGDEFRILSSNTDSGYWMNMRKVINGAIAEYAEKEKLAFTFGVSLGFNIVDEDFPMSFEECCDKADYFMYEDKSNRKGLLFLRY